jgi:glycine/D-amino acid oxidase-like deaminating enzyme
MAGERHVLVIGSGAAGSACARTLAAAGVRATVVENDRVGGTCLCMAACRRKGNARFTGPLEVTVGRAAATPYAPSSARPKAFRLSKSSTSTRTSRGRLPSGGPTTPLLSSMSMMRPARA